MEGINFVTDENNKRIAVQLSYDVYGEFLEDLIDGLIAESRKNEESVPFEQALEELKLEGKIDG